MHVVIDRHPKHGIHFRVLAKCLRLLVITSLEPFAAVCRWKVIGNSTLGYVDQLRESFVPEDRSRGVFFDQDWGRTPGVFAVASVVFMWHMPCLSQHIW